VSIARQIANDIGRALAVLAMVFLCFAGAVPDNSGGGSVVQQAGVAASSFQSLCGGHGQPQLACHAPTACCRPDQALLPPSTLAAEPAFQRVAAVSYPQMPAAGNAISAPSPFRSRAPPV